MLNKLLNYLDFIKNLIMFFVDDFAIILLVLGIFFNRLGEWYFPNNFIFGCYLLSIIGTIIFNTLAYTDQLLVMLGLMLYGLFSSGIFVRLVWGVFF